MFTAACRLSSHPAKIKSRPNLPCGATESIELICLVILTADFLLKVIFVMMLIFFC